MELITIKTFDNSIDAHLLRIELENEGIECYIYDEHTVTVFPLYSNAVGGVKVKILKTDLERARNIVHPSKAFAICPNCNSQNVISNYKSMKGVKGFLSAFTSLFTSTYPLHYKVVNKCRDCNEEFIENEDSTTSSVA